MASKHSITHENLCDYIINNNQQMFNQTSISSDILNDLCEKNGITMTMLGHALYYKRDFFVKKLLAIDGIEVDRMSSEDSALAGVKNTLSPFHCAIINGSLPFVEQIWNKLDSDKETQKNLLARYCLHGNMGLTAFQAAVYENQHEIYRYLIELSEHVDIQKPICYVPVISVNGPTNVVELAASRRQFTTVKFLLDLKTISYNLDESELKRGSHAFLLDSTGPVFCKYQGTQNKYHPLFVAILYENTKLIRHLSKCACPLPEILPSSSFSTRTRQTYSKKIKKGDNITIKGGDLDSVLQKKCVVCQESFNKRSHISRVKGCDCGINGQDYHTHCLVKILHKRGVDCMFCNKYITQYHVLNVSSKKKKRKRKK